MLIRLTMLALLTLALGAGTSEAAIILADDFEGDAIGDTLDDADNPIDQWTELSSTPGFSEASNVTIVQDLTDGVNSTNVLESNPTLNNFIFVRSQESQPKTAGYNLRADVRMFPASASDNVGQGTGNSNIGIGNETLGTTGAPSDRYTLNFLGAANEIGLIKVDDGSVTNLAGPDEPFPGFSVFDWHTYELQVLFGDVNDTLSVLVDGVPIFTDITTPALDLGTDFYAMLGTGGGRQVRYDNIQGLAVTAVPEPSSLLLLGVGALMLAAFARRQVGARAAAHVAVKRCLEGLQLPKPARRF